MAAARGSSIRAILVRRDADGFITFVGRRDQQIKSHGFESVRGGRGDNSHSKLVAEVIARGVPDEVAAWPWRPRGTADADGFTVESLLATAKPRCRATWCRTDPDPRVAAADSSGKVDRRVSGV